MFKTMKSYSFPNINNGITGIFLSLNYAKIFESILDERPSTSSLVVEHITCVLITSNEVNQPLLREF